MEDIKGKRLVSGTHVWKFDEDMKTGKMTQEECEFAESCMSRSIGHCMTMGTASTMACMVESLGLDTYPVLLLFPLLIQEKK